MIRDHTYPCEHPDAYEVGPTLPIWLCGLNECPGGRKLSLTDALEWALTQAAKTPNTHIPMEDDDD